jgi:hypothetical protein
MKSPQESFKMNPLPADPGGFEQAEVTEAQIIQALDAKGIEDVETKELLVKYASKLESDFENKNPQDPNRAHFECTLTLARMYAKTEKYKEYALQSVKELFEANTLKEDRDEEIKDLIDSLWL